MALNLGSLLRWASTLGCVIWVRTSPLGLGGLRRCHVPHGSRPRLQAKVGSSAVTCPMASDLTTRLRWAPTLLCAHGSRPHLQAEVDSGAAMCPMTLALISWLRWAPVLPCVLWLWTSPLGWGGLRCCHVSYAFGPCLLTEMRSGTAMCPVALDLAYWLRLAPMLLRFPWLPVGHGPQA
jgi:hypothetical protein